MSQNNPSAIYTMLVKLASSSGEADFAQHASKHGLTSAIEWMGDVLFQNAKMQELCQPLLSTYATTAHDDWIGLVRQERTKIARKILSGYGRPTSNKPMVNLRRAAELDAMISFLDHLNDVLGEE